MKIRSILLLLGAQIAALSLWFLSAAILPDMLKEVAISAPRQAALSSGVQIGFVAGALISAILGLADRYDPRHVFAGAAISAGLINLTLIIIPPGQNAAVIARFLTGFCLAGVYPVGMKIAVSWGEKDRGFLVSALIGALTLGSAMPHLFVIIGGAEWRWIVATASGAAVVSGLVCLCVGLGPHYRKAAAFNPGTVFLAWTNKRVRLAYIGYLGHMWELYALWAWLATIALASYSTAMDASAAQRLATWTAFLAIASGAPGCLIAGALADRFGKARMALAILILSGSSAILAALSFGGPVWLICAILIFWGAMVIPDSGLFSALVADASPPESTGSLMTLQTALGFALTFFTVQITPVAAETFGWPVVLASLALGPLIGAIAMRRLDIL